MAEGYTSFCSLPPQIVFFKIFEKKGKVKGPDSILAEADPHCGPLPGASLACLLSLAGAWPSTSPLAGTAAAGPENSCSL